MAAPLSKENRAKILEYLSQLDLSKLTGIEIKKLIETNLDIRISQPTASKFKAELLCGNQDDNGFVEDECSLKRPVISEKEESVTAEATKSDKIRQISQTQMNTIEHLLQGQSDRAVAEAVGVARQTVWEWRNHDPLFIAELNRQRVELWYEARERLKSLANRALDVVETHLGSGDPKAALAAAKYVLQGTRLLGDTDLYVGGPTTPEDVILAELREEARQELMVMEQNKVRNPMLEFNPIFRAEFESGFEDRVEALAKSRLKQALAEAGLS